MFCSYEIHQTGMLQIVFLVSLESSQQGGVQGLGSMTFGLAVQKFRGKELWVITEILYAEKLSVASADSNSIGGGANTSGAALLPVGVPGPVGGKIKASTTLDNGLDFIAQDNNPFMFAYGAICAQYDCTGDYVIHKLNAGKHPLKTRSHESGGNSSTQMHLEGLFLNPPTGDQQDDEDLQCLEIVDAVDNDD